MPWIQIRINATAKTADKVSNMLLGRGAQAVTFMDAQDVPVYEPLPGETPLWGETEVMGLFDAETDPAPTIAFFQKIFGEEVGYKVEQLEDKDWVREWMDHFHPMQFGERLWICPSWRDVPNPDAVNVMLDPGLAFGTGTHPTTALCLQWLDGLDLTGKTVVDFGCGSGILGIAALKLGAARVIGIDIDPQAIQASRDNAERNGVAGQIELYLPADQPQDVEADVVVANILAGPLRELAPLIAGHGKAGSLMALSGVLESQAPELETIYGQWFDMDPTAVKEEWCRLS
ncbi:50S ribosomal protein L11 methyltransferase, partial [Aeromonas sobria]|uniref:50S ribosomal protein L11 methyltransferase n=1 Tax=Aeromonas sobria TaxID=646 RepID=UPI0026E9A7DD